MQWNTKKDNNLDIQMRSTWSTFDAFHPSFFQNSETNFRIDQNDASDNDAPLDQIRT